ncbi:beta-arrestin-1-like [Varanus komodoensis]|uniref:beta-arrestin-1-like n=1 Tax=Varanus komodoensis TaxID=61221 RepID=UPI001CF7E9D4|nr:beta-arrestin-1-like [Varanus komodoensis]
MRLASGPLVVAEPANGQRLRGRLAVFLAQDLLHRGKCNTFGVNLKRVFKEASPNGKLTVYLGKQDFVDHIDVVNPVVFATLTCAFRYGREDLDVLGLTFRKDLFVASAQAFPPVPEEKKPLTRLQERLIRKLGEQAHPFTFEGFASRP